MTTIVPTQPDVVYVPYLRDPLKKAASYVPELDSSRMRRGELVADILAGEHHHGVAYVHAYDIAAGTSWDATREIADDVFNAVIKAGEGPPEHLVGFLEDHIAMTELAPLLRDRVE
jgi:hypothetical protein